MPDTYLDALVIWEPTGAADDGSGLPYPTHTGVLSIGELTIRCYQLSDGRRLIDAEDAARLFQLLAGDE